MKPKRVYYMALDGWDPDEEVRDAPAIPPRMIGSGKVLHLATNKTSEMAFGVPAFRRLLRWFTAYNEVIESYADRMKAAAKLYMGRPSRAGSPRSSAPG